MPTISVDFVSPGSDLDTTMPRASFLKGPARLFVSSSSSKVEDDDYRLDGKFAFKGKGFKRVINWKKSRVDSVKFGYWADDYHWNWEVSGLGLKGNKFVDFASKDPSGKSFYDFITGSGAVFWSDYSLYGVPLQGGPGADHFNTQHSGDVITGGGGADVISVVHGETVRIKDFNASEGDRLEVIARRKGKGFDPMPAYEVVDLSLASVQYSPAEGATYVRVGASGASGGTTFVLEGVTGFDLGRLSVGEPRADLPWFW